MKYPEKFKSYIKGLCAELRKYFYCQEMELDIVFENEVEGSESVAAHIKTDFKYLGYTIFIRPPILRMYEKKDYEAIIQCLAHEHSHILTDPLYTIAINGVTNTSAEFLEEVRERQTQRITNLILPNIPKKFYIPKIKKIKPSKAKRKK